MLSYIYNYFENQNLILEKNENMGNLWLGNHYSKNVSFLKNNNINLVINCTNNVSSPNLNSVSELFILKYYRIPVNDIQHFDEYSTMINHLKIVIPILYESLITNKENVLIHCHQGAQRSAICTLVFLMFLYKQKIINMDILEKDTVNEKINKIILFIQTKRKRVFRFGTKINFYPILNYFITYYKFQ